MTDRPGLEFSFSGLKTFALNTWQQCRDAGDDNEQTRCDLSLAFQQAVVETLTIKCKRALKQTGLKRLVIAGGVSANKALRASSKTCSPASRATCTTRARSSAPTTAR